MEKYPAFFTIFLFAALLHAQSTPGDTTKIRVELKDGSTLIGTIAEEDSLAVRFITSGGVTMTIPHQLIRFKYPYSPSASSPASVTAPTVDTLKKAKYSVDPNRTRLFLMPTARPIGAGQGYFSAYELFFPTIAMGIGGNISVAGGMSLIPGANSQLLYLAPKVSIVNTPTVSLAVGGLYFGTGDKDDGTSLLYAAGTFGNERGSVTFSARIPTAQDQSSLVVIGGELQTSESFKLITENWIFDDNIIYGFGFRFFSEKLAADLGFFRSSKQTSGDGFPFFPWLGFAYNFGNTGQPQEEYRDHHDFHHVSLRGKISYNFFTIGSDDGIRQGLKDQGYYIDENSGGLFSSGSGNNSSGSGVLLQVEHPVRENIFAGITYSSLGDLIGTKPAFNASLYSYLNSYYTNIYLTFSKSISTYAAHIAYSSVNSTADRDDRSFTAGAGFGMSTIETAWEYSTYYGQSASGGTSGTHSALTTLLFLSFDQRITENISIGIDGSYFLMADVDIGTFPLYSTVYTDYSVNPTVQRTVNITIKKITANFSYGKIGLNLGVNL
ncbi:MAG: hypothetical protein ACOYNS_02765 [Bacteroidota bacterium]